MSLRGSGVSIGGFSILRVVGKTHKNIESVKNHPKNKGLMKTIGLPQ